MDSLLLTVPEAARLLAVSRQTIYRLVHDGGLEAVVVRSVIRIPRSGLETFVGSGQGHR